MRPHGVVQASLLQVPQADAPVPAPRGQQRQLGRGRVRPEGQAGDGHLLLEADQQLVRLEIEDLRETEGGGAKTAL